MVLNYIFLIFLLTFSLGDYADQKTDRIALIDTGYDLCHQLGLEQCSQNKNLLLRSANPHFDKNTSSKDNFRRDLLNSINNLSKSLTPETYIPKTLAELENYRIVLINLTFSKEHEHEKDAFYHEYNSATSFQISLQIPKKQHIYNLSIPFDKNQFAFIWSPMELKYPTIDDFEKKSLLVSEIEITTLNLVKNLLLQKSHDKHPLLIVYHCIAGKDRTGMLTMGYYQTYGGYSPSKRKAPYRIKKMNFHDSYIETASIGVTPNTKAQMNAYLFCKHKNLLRQDNNACALTLSQKIRFLYHLLIKSA